MTRNASEPTEAAIAWEGDSKDIISGFPDDVKQNFGFQLRQLQQGEEPSNYRPVRSIGPGVYELRDQDERTWYRVIYLSRVNDVIYVLHCFEKKSREIPRNELNTVEQRLKNLKARMIQEKKNAKRGFG